MERRSWTPVVGAAVVLALLSLASNVTTAAQTTGGADALLAVRGTLSRLLNAGTVWAGLGVLAGWLLRRPARAAVGGVLSLLTACVVHYGTGRVLGVFEPSVWADNSSWFAAAVVVGGPLGLVGALARRPGGRGVPARLVVPAGAVLEPFVTGLFATPAVATWPQRVADLASGTVLLTAGAAGCLAVLAATRRAPRRPRARAAA
ncbi:hypothetical protein [Kineococcus gypseus]|uniref:hypothetical protein n=1 Tax=Kineococcus gypseus TaxID=1637102 RepID=UPI003D7E766E